MKNKFSKTVFLSFVILPVLLFPFSCDSLKDDAGIFISYDHGLTWEQKGQISKKETLGNKNILSVSFDVQNPRVIFVGTDGKGLFKTLDAGELWYRVGDQNNVLPEQISVYDIALDPSNSGRVYLAALGSDYGYCFRSEDGGVSWEQVYKTSKEKQAVLVLAVDGRNTNKVYLGTAEGGILASDDYGKSWRALKWLGVAVSDIAIDPQNSANLYVATQGEGILKSTNFGVDWVSLGVNSKKIWDLKVLSSSSAVLLAAAADGLLRSVDHGLSWEKMNVVIPPESLPVLNVAFNSQNNNEIFFGAGGVVYKTVDAGQSWQVYPLKTTKKIRVLEINPNFPENILAGIHN